MVYFKMGWRVHLIDGGGKGPTHVDLPHLSFLPISENKERESDAAYSEEQKVQNHEHAHVVIGHRWRSARIFVLCSSIALNGTA